MRMMIVAAALAAAIATPAAAQVGPRAEARGGVAFADGSSEAFVGAAIGYDMPISGTAFIGVEGSLDKVLVKGSDVLWGVKARLGTQTSPAGKVYLSSGVAFTKDSSAFEAGLGYQHMLSSNMYGKVEYRRAFAKGPDLNMLGVGLGIQF